MLAEVYTIRIEARRIVQSLAQIPTLEGLHQSILS